MAKVTEEMYGSGDGAVEDKCRLSVPTKKLRLSLKTETITENSCIDVTDWKHQNDYDEHKDSTMLPDLKRQTRKSARHKIGLKKMQIEDTKVKHTQIKKLDKHNNSQEKKKSEKSRKKKEEGILPEDSHNILKITNFTDMYEKLNVLKKQSLSDVSKKQLDHTGSSIPMSKQQIDDKIEKLESTDTAKESFKSAQCMVVKKTLLGNKVVMYCNSCDLSFSSESHFGTHVHYKHEGDWDNTIGKQHNRVAQKKINVVKQGTKKRNLRKSSQLEKNCKVCGKNLCNKQTLKDHMNIRNGLRPCVCEECGKSYKDNGSLSCHKKSHDIKESVCPVCSKAFMCMSYLKIHMKTHSSERKFKCEICSKTFVQKSHLNKHIKCIHDKIKDHVCDVCDKAFSDKWKLVLHKRNHTNERPYVCEICRKTFKDGSYLNIHIRYHTGARPYACLQCDKTFVQAIDMKRHSLVHKEELPYKCKICNHKSRLESNMRVHIKIHAGAVYTCNVCRRDFSTSNSRDRHMNTQHTLDNGMKLLVQQGN
ncbi:zinc finger protein OZF-like isoform X2 [Mercenaria mercenaria]|nr:zinc finger protein OZF-like isoform X2 [Mercenaria mercenaria]XP_053373439.1 zinc finger protein OZF-like isoform X2 [Mercenaria mercenaria]XP_053373440.1 zinc finger protein OZF-like isoform X2 [Mercenaria mercenaria]